MKVGDVVSKINGLAVSGLSYDAVISRLQYLPRPIVIHFAQVLPAASSSLRKVTEEENASTSSLEVGVGANVAVENVEVSTTTL